MHYYTFVYVITCVIALPWDGSCSGVPAEFQSWWCRTQPDWSLQTDTL